jgi:hypothetical protein
MKLKELFNLKYGVNKELINMIICDKKNPNAVPFVSRKSQNQGISAYVLKDETSAINSKNTISVAVSGSVLSSFLHKYEYYSGRDVYILSPIKEMSDVEMIFYCKIINMNKFKYNYGRQANKTLGDLEVPNFNGFFNVNNINIKDYEIDEEPCIKCSDSTKYKIFEIKELFDITGTKTTKPDDIKKLKKGKYPYITTKSSNNGIESYHDFYTEIGNILTIESAVLGFCTYQKENFTASDHVEKLIPKFTFNEYCGIYFSTLINKHNFKFNYGRKANQERIKTLKILVPINDDENVNVEYIENYIKSLRFSKVLSV